MTASSKPLKMCCVCDSGILVVLLILSALLTSVGILLFYDIVPPCDKSILNSTVKILTDNKPLLNSIASSKQVQSKMMKTASTERYCFSIALCLVSYTHQRPEEND